VNKREISAEESCSDHSFLKYKIGTANSFNNVCNYQSIRYIVNGDKYHEFDRKLVQETLQILKNKLQRNCRRNGLNLATVDSKANDLEMLVDTFTAALQSARRETFKTISTENKTKKKK
jgi:phosphoribulokinase